jgi:hypothetical protein
MRLVEREPRKPRKNFLDVFFLIEIIEIKSKFVAFSVFEDLLINFKSLNKEPNIYPKK